MIKGDFHIHTNLDKKEFLLYSPKKLIDRAFELGFKVLALTHHEQRIFPQKAERYAKKKGIVLFSGVEFDLEGCHVVALNVTPHDVKKVKKLADLKKIYRKDVVIFVPHLYYPFSCSVGNRIHEILPYVDALEFHSFYCILGIRFFNTKMAKFAQKNKIPVIGNTDLHFLSHLDRTYTLLDIKGKVTKEKVIKAIKEGKVSFQTRPLPIIFFILTTFYHICPVFIKKLLNMAFR